MVSDSEMPDAPSGEEGSSYANHTLIRVVRGLDQEGPGENGEKLAELWNALSHNASGQFYAAEQSTLRWLLKVMNPSTKSPAESETLRRFPLTWNILNCVFKRIPLFSLAKALADRRFISVLRQTVKDLSSPSGEDDVTISSDRKRKRSTPIGFKLDDLRKPTGCLKSAEALFEALSSLLSRLSSVAEVSTREAVGAEHVRSLFASSGAESLELVVPMLAICYNSLEVHGGDFAVNVSWVKVASDIWDLRLRSGVDTLEIATRAAQTTLAMFGHLDEKACQISGEETKYSHIPEHVRRSWATGLQDFLQRNLFLPARTAYTNSADLEPLNMAVLMSQRHLKVTAPAIYLLAQNSPKPFDEKSKEKVEDWINEVVKAVDGSLRNAALDVRSRILEGVMAEAEANSIRISEQVLRDICSKYGFEDGVARWSILSSALRLDPDILFDRDQSSTLLDEILKSISSLDGSSEGVDCSQHVNHILDAIIKAFVNAKDMPGFFKLWHDQLLKAKTSSSPWLQQSIRRNSTIFAHQRLELAITVNQLQDVLDWLAAQSQENPEPLLVIVDSIVHGIGTVAFTDTLAKKISTMVLETLTPKSSSTSASSLRWTVLSKVITWIRPDERESLWTRVQQNLVAVLQLGQLSDQETFEAFKFVFVVWSFMTPDGDHLGEVSSPAMAAIARLTKEVPAKAGKKLPLEWKFRAHNDASSLAPTQATPEAYLATYLDYTFVESSRSLSLVSNASAESIFPEYLDAILELFVKKTKKQRSKAELSDSTPTLVKQFFRALISNENLVNSRSFMDNLIGRIVSTMRSQFKVNENEILDSNLASLFLEIPNDCLTRPQRELAANMILERLESLEAKKEIMPSQWKLVLAVLTKLMKRPTFCESLDFNRLVTLAEQVSHSFGSGSEPHSIDKTRGLASIYQDFAFHVLTLMANDFDHRGKTWFEDAASYVKTCPTDDKSTHKCRLRLYLLKALVGVLSTSSYLNGSSSPLVPDIVRAKLAEAISSTLKKGGKHLKKQPEELETGIYVYTMLAALECADVVQASQLERKSVPVDALSVMSTRGISSHRLSGWKIRAFLLRHYPDAVDSIMGPIGPGREEAHSQQALDVLRDRDLPPLVLECTNIALQSLRVDGDRLLFLKDLIDRLEFGPDAEGQLIAIRCVVQSLAASPPSSSFKDYDLSAAYTMLAQKSLQADSGARFGKICNILHVILDSNAGHVAQWNIEETLSLVAVICSNCASASRLTTSAKTFYHLCKLVEAILKRYRLRLEGHFHLLIAAMQSLLTALLLHPYDSGRGSWAAAPLDMGRTYPGWEEDATAYNRLLTLICEPTVGSVTRSHHGGMLDAAADVAKRSAGRQVYLVLTTYVRLQMQVGVPRPVREALEPGVNAMFDVTPGEVRRVMNDGLDKAGREILGDLYRRYRMFGKWTGK